MVAIIALTLAIAAVGCGGQQPAQETPSTEAAPPAEQPMMEDTTMHADSSSMQH
jgi:hypothetical protein